MVCGLFDRTLADVFTVHMTVLTIKDIALSGDLFYGMQAGVSMMLMGDMKGGMAFFDIRLRWVYRPVQIVAKMLNFLVFFQNEISTFFQKGIARV